MMKLKILSALMLVLSLVYVLVFTPEEQSQGFVQKIFYIHVSSAITMYFGFFIAFVTSIMHLWDKKRVWDHMAYAGVEVGYIFCCIVLCTGPLWAKPIWGTFWTWEPRLTTTFLLFLMYTAYLVLRQYLKGQKQETRIAAVIAIIAFLDVPLIHYSVKLWRGIHPSVISEKNGLPTSMQQALLLMMCSLIFVFLMMWWERFKLFKLEAQLKQQQLEQS
ncbi:MAG TPA: cytochrome c biogenesis protein CcsA [Oligoflexia bacterium]|nr:cytochrome c biogenesis protein CcsA [Oligoflexia bacterium]HMR25641.1 cytochrome c biogenesis protein CcsA [Oligoflexia bacterium]